MWIVDSHGVQLSFPLKLGLKQPCLAVPIIKGHFLDSSDFQDSPPAMPSSLPLLLEANEVGVLLSPSSLETQPRFGHFNGYEAILFQPICFSTGTLSVLLSLLRGF